MPGGMLSAANAMRERDRTRLTSERHQRDRREQVLPLRASGHSYRGRRTGGAHVQNEKHGRNEPERKNEQ